MGFGRRTVLDHTQSKLMRNVLCKERAGRFPALFDAAERRGLRRCFSYVVASAWRQKRKEQ